MIDYDKMDTEINQLSREQEIVAAKIRIFKQRKKGLKARILEEMSAVSINRIALYELRCQLADSTYDIKFFNEKLKALKAEYITKTQK